MTKESRLDVVIYCRVSKDLTGEMAAVTRQLEDCRAKAALQGWNVVTEVIDNDVSAAGAKDRPGFEQVLDMLATGKARGVVSWAFDRLTRNRRDTVRLLEVGEKTRAMIGLVRGSDLDLSTPSGRLVADLLAGVSRHEIDAKSDRQLRAVLQLAQAGKTSGGARRFGYQPGNMVIRETEASAIRQAYQGLLSIDATVALAAVARAWNAAELFPPQGSSKWQHWCDPDCGEDDPKNCPNRIRPPSKWTGQTVSRTLRNPAYIGKRTHRGEIVADAAWPPLVDEPTWRAAQVVLNAPGRGKPGRRPRLLLTGVARCGICGSPAHGSGATWANRSGYRCSGSLGHFSRIAAPIDDYVTRAALAWLARPEAQHVVLQPAESEAVDLSAFADERAALVARLDEIADMAADGVMNRKQVQRANERVQARIDEIDAMYVTAGRVDVIGDLVGAADLPGAWAALGTDRQRTVIGELMEVTIHPAGRGVRTFRPESVGIKWRG